MTTPIGLVEKGGGYERMYNLRTVSQKTGGYVRSALRNKVTVSLGYIAYIGVICFIIYLFIT